MTQLNVQDLGTIIKNRRKTLKLNQSQVATAINVTRQWVASVENGKASVPMGMVLNLLKYLNIPLNIGHTETQTINTFSRFFAEGVAKKIADAHANLKPGEGEEREAAVLFIDLKGFTHLAQNATPNEIMRLLSEYQTRVVQAVDQHKGDIDKFLGDGIMASFGAVTSSSTYAADALRCAEYIFQLLKIWQAERTAGNLPAPDIGIGIAVGKVIFGAVGNAQRMEFTLIGEAVNLAAKLEKHTRKEQAHIITTRKSLDLASHQGYVLPSSPKIIEKVILRGMTAQIDLVVLG